MSFPSFISRLTIRTASGGLLGVHDCPVCRGMYGGLRGVQNCHVWRGRSGGLCEVGVMRGGGYDGWGS